MWVIPKALLFEILKTSYLTFTFAAFLNQCNSRTVTVRFQVRLFTWNKQVRFFVLFGVFCVRDRGLEWNAENHTEVTIKIFGIQLIHYLVQYK